MIINFHGIGEAHRTLEPGEQDYWIKIAHFEQILDWIQRQSRPVKISFDDGNSSDAIIALPRLQARKLGADFFVLAGKLGEMGYLTFEQVREIYRSPNCRVGTHGMCHRAWANLKAPDRDFEIIESCQILSETTGSLVSIAGLPFGNYDRATIKTLKAAGLVEIYSSDGADTLLNVTPVPRFSVRRDTTLECLDQIMRRSNSLLARSVQLMRVLTKSLR